MKEVFLDTETTGLSFKEGHKIVEIACVETKDLIATGRVFHKLINPKRDVPEQAFKIHGYSERFLKDKETFDVIADDFLNGELKSLNKDLIDQSSIVDSLELSRNKFPGTSNSLDALCRRFNIDISKRTKHNALLDCELLREVYINLLDAKEPKLNLSSAIAERKISKNSTYNKKILAVPTAELQLHEEFLKKELKKNHY